MGYTLATLSFKASARIAAYLHSLAPSAGAAVFDGGPSIDESANEVASIPGISHQSNLMDFVISIITRVLDFVTLVAVIVVIVAGIRLIVSMGNDEQKDKAKKSIIYMVIGLAVIILSRIIVLFVVNIFNGTP